MKFNTALFLFFTYGLSLSNNYVLADTYDGLSAASLMPSEETILEQIESTRVFYWSLINPVVAAVNDGLRIINSWPRENPAFPGVFEDFIDDNAKLYKIVKLTGNSGFWYSDYVGVEAILSGLDRYIEGLHLISYARGWKRAMDATMHVQLEFKQGFQGLEDLEEAHGRSIITLLRDTMKEWRSGHNLPFDVTGETTRLVEEENFRNTDWLKWAATQEKASHKPVPGNSPNEGNPNSAAFFKRKYAEQLLKKFSSLMKSAGYLEFAAEKNLLNRDVRKDILAKIPLPMHDAREEAIENSLSLLNGHNVVKFPLKAFTARYDPKLHQRGRDFMINITELLRTDLKTSKGRRYAYPNKAADQRVLSGERLRMDGSRKLQVI